MSQRYQLVAKVDAQVDARRAVPHIAHLPAKEGVRRAVAVIAVELAKRHVAPIAAGPAKARVKPNVPARVTYINFYNNDTKTKASDYNAMG